MLPWNGGGRWLVVSAFMKRFNFKLEAVRRIREQEEQLVQVELATAVRARGEVVAELERSKAAEADLHAYLRSPQLSASDMLHVSRFDELHRQKIFQLSVQLRSSDEFVARVRQRLVVARARREALDRLKERQQDAHRLAGLAEEAKELDEIGTQLRQRQAVAAAASMAAMAAPSRRAAA